MSTLRTIPVTRFDGEDPVWSGGVGTNDKLGW